MPYINSERKQFLAVIEPYADTAGELNYRITRVIQKYLYSHKNNYQTINDIIGALEGAKTEFQRRVVNPYEDKKILENGDVY